ncbi:MAG: hypothetical protein ACD_80C00120G0008, partial [uncultured bacterium (gcode 4)]
IVEDKDLWEHLVESNKNIEDFVLDTKTNTLDTKEIEDNKDISKTMGDKLGAWYKDEIQEGITQLLKKNKLDSYTKNFDASGKTINTDKIPEKDKKKLEKISAKIIDTFTGKVEEELLKNTNEVIKTKAVGALVKNIGQYFQVKNYQQEDFAKDFDIDTKNGITFDGKILRLSWSMEGKEIGFDYDMETGEITADDFVHYNQKDKTFYINKDWGAEGRERLPLKMQTLNEMLATSKTETTKNITKSIDESKKTGDFKEKLSNNTTIDYRQESSGADIIIEHTMAKNIAIQETQDFLKKYIPEKDKYSLDKESKEFSLYKIIDTSLDRYTADEIIQRRNLLSRFEQKITAAKPSFKDKMIKNLFKGNTIKNDQKGEYDNEKWPNLYQFIRGITYEQPGITKNDVINLSFFEQVVQELESNEGDTKKLSSKSNKYNQLRIDYENKKENESADNIDFNSAFEL